MSSGRSPNWSRIRARLASRTSRSSSNWGESRSGNRLVITGLAGVGNGVIVLAGATTATIGERLLALRGHGPSATSLPRRSDVMATNPVTPGGEPLSVRQLWQAPTFLLGLTTLAAFLLARPLWNNPLVR